MRITAAVTPSRPRNFAATAVAFAFLLVSFAWTRSHGPWNPKEGVGLGFGVLAAAVYVFSALYPWRRKTPRFATARHWAQAHVYLGTLAFLATVLHAGFAWPRGTQGALLLGLSAWAALSGLLGVFLQKWIPSMITEGLRVEVLLERIPELAGRVLAQADARVEGAGEVLTRFYRHDLRPRLAEPDPSWAYLLDVRAGRERAIEPLRRLSGFVPAEDRPRVLDLESLYVEKLELDAHLGLQRFLRRWVALHSLPAGVLMALIAFHVWAWVWY